MAMTLVSTVTVGSGGAANIEITSIPQDATDLVLLLSLRGASSDTTTQVEMQFNNTGTYDMRYLQGSESSVSSEGFTNETTVLGRFFTPANTSTSNTFGNQIVYVTNYATSQFKSISWDMSMSTSTASPQRNQIIAANFKSTNAITSIKFTAFGGGFVQNSTVSLYKIK
jgi:hypothetical protein